MENHLSTGERSTRWYLKTAILIGVPVVLQNMVSSLINALDVFMLGQLGETAITAASVSNQWFLLFCLLANGIASAGAMFISQYWGIRDYKRIHHYMGIMFYGTIVMAVVFFTVSMCMPESILKLYSLDQLVIAEGTRYLRIIAVCFVLYAVNVTCSSALRCIGETKIPMMASVASLICNGTANYLLIFGIGFIPAMGVTGAALATMLARIVETSFTIEYIIIKKPPVFGRLIDYLMIPKKMVRQYVKMGSLIIIGEIVYAVGSNLYNVAYKYTGTQAQASLQIVQTIQSLALLFCGGFGTAVAVMLGSMLGKEEFDEAKKCSRILMIFSLVTAAVSTLVIMGCVPLFLQIFRIAETSKDQVRIMLYIMALSVPLRTAVFVIICGILRSGGDNFYCFIANLVGVWAIGLPAVFLAAVIFKAPVWVVYLMAVMEEAGKLLICGPRVLKGKWLRNLTG